MYGFLSVVSSIKTRVASASQMCKEDKKKINAISAHDRDNRVDAVCFERY